MADPDWLQIAGHSLGLQEVPGPATNPTIALWLKQLHAWWSDDQTPWCGTFVAHCMQQANLPIPKNWFRAKEWLDWGTPCPAVAGAVCVLDREGGGHVFMLTQISATRVRGIGGNQHDGVNLSVFSRDRVLGLRWPDGVPIGPLLPLLPDALAAAPVSTNEA